MKQKVVCHLGDMVIDPDQSDTTEDICRDLGISESTVLRMVNLFRTLLRQELARTGIICDDKMCR